MRIVVVGASLAGVRTVQALRRLGSTARITLVDARPEVACDRPPLSKAFLADPATPARPVATREQLEQLDVELLLGWPAARLDAPNRSLELRDGTVLRYDALVAATGSNPRTTPALRPGPGVHVLRTGEHATQLRDRLAEGTRLVIVGGGFIGAEVAWTARGLGCRVTVVEPLPSLMMRGLGPVLGEVLSRRHARSGADLRLGVGVKAIDGGQVHLSDGCAVPADEVLLALGTTPEVGWLEGAGLRLDNGLICDEHLAAVGAPGVYAAGDLARWWHPRYAEHVRVEHWTNAVEQAPVVAANLTGTPTSYDAMPYVWSDQLGGRLQIIGRVRPHDEIRFVYGGPDEERFVAITGGDGVLQSVVGFGAVRELMPYRKLLVEGGSWAAALDLARTAA
ncbi:MAG TPA: FAD-dependent oxidoreductase [Pseudonocardiaceae bacterium]|jgi:3-phenylpropionate/trans-cinnamate dioxygenase ferredoxin reductase subunit